MGHNLNLRLGQALLAAALHNEGDTAPPGFHGATAVEDVSDVQKNAYFMNSAAFINRQPTAGEFTIDC